MCKREDHPKHLPELLGVYLALFDTLVDDDEDVRDQGAKTVSLLLSAVKSKRSPGSAISFSLSPPAAKRRLTRFLEKSYRKSKELWFEAVERLIGIQAVRSARIRKRSNDPADFDEEMFLQLRPVAELSIEARTTYVRVFVEEKQNLYIDSVREADEWATTMVQLDPDAWDPNTILVLESWTVEGLTYYIDTYEDHIDGALSPISKPEVYTLFMRVILSARVLMSRSAPASGKGKAKEDACKGLLEKLLELGKQRLLHDLLLDRIKWILEGVKHPNQQS